MEKSKKIVIIIVFIMTTILLMGILTNYDNKYNYMQPIGENGTLKFTAEDIERPMFLIDGWIASFNDSEPHEIYTGQYFNFSMFDKNKSPYGHAVYKLKLETDDQMPTLTLKIPEIFDKYQLYIDGEIVSSSGQNTIVNFKMEHSCWLELHVENYRMYYSGMIYPIVFGTVHNVGVLHSINMFIYMFVCVLALIIFIFALGVSFEKKHRKLYFHLALLALSVVFMCIHAINWQLGLSNNWTFAIEDVARTMLFAEALMITMYLGEFKKKKLINKIYAIMVVIAIMQLIFVALLLPGKDNLVVVYLYFTNISSILSWIILSVVCAFGIDKADNLKHLAPILGSTAIGVSIMLSIFSGNLYEPIYTMWHIEWAALIMLIIYSCAVIIYTKNIIRENEEMKENLEEMVEQRSEELRMVIEERKRFFSDMAHNLKSPITTIHGFISLIQQHQVGLDDELMGYIAIIKDENLEMQKRVQSLNIINAFDKIDETRKKWHINEILQEVDDFNRASAEVKGVYLTVERVNNNACIFVQKEKILIMFENLIFNAVSFTEPEGRISIQAKLLKDKVTFIVSDTGCGIKEEALPYIFDRFYVGRENRSEGSGLGLYIVKLTVDEFGGDISVKSEVGVGTEFRITLPVTYEKK